MSTGKGQDEFESLEPPGLTDADGTVREYDELSESEQLQALKGRIRQRRKQHTNYRSPVFQDLFVEAVGRLGFLSHACKELGVWPNGVYIQMKRDPDFKERVDEAKEANRLMKADAAEGELYRRGVVGVRKPVIYQGQITDHYTEHSDRCLEVFLRGAIPSRYKDKGAQVGGDDAPNRGVLVVQAQASSLEDWEAEYSDASEE